MAEGEPRLRIVDELWRQLAAIEPALDLRARRAVARRRTLRVALLVVLSLLVLAAAAVAAALLFGSTAQNHTPLPPNVTGTFNPRTVRLLSARVDDPAGGPPWGMRVATTTKRLACVQTGRLVKGRLVALGVDGAFSNDGLAHPLAIGTENCGGLDDVGNLRVSGSPTIYTASATVGEPGCRTAEQIEADRSTVDETRKRLRHPLSIDTPHVQATERKQLKLAEHRLAHPTRSCHKAEQRTVLFGFDGPTAKTVTLTGAPGGTKVVHPASRDDGGYLFVIEGHSLPALEGLRITITYANGLRCVRPQPYDPMVQTRTKACFAVPPGYVYRHRGP